MVFASTIGSKQDPLFDRKSNFALVARYYPYTFLPKWKLTGKLMKIKGHGLGLGKFIEFIHLNAVTFDFLGNFPNNWVNLQNFHA